MSAGSLPPPPGPPRAHRGFLPGAAGSLPGRGRAPPQTVPPPSQQRRARDSPLLEIGFHAPVCCVRPGPRARSLLLLCPGAAGGGFALAIYNLCRGALGLRCTRGVPCLSCSAPRLCVLPAPVVAVTAPPPPPPAAATAAAAAPPATASPAPALTAAARPEAAEASGAGGDSWQAQPFPCPCPCPCPHPCPLPCPMRPPPVYPNPSLPLASPWQALPRRAWGPRALLCPCGGPPVSLGVCLVCAPAVCPGPSLWRGTGVEGLLVPMPFIGEFCRGNSVSER